MTTAFLYDDRFLEHNPGAGHPERRERLERTIGHLRSLDWFDQLSQVETRTAERRWIEGTHSANLIERAASACSNGAPFLDVADVGISAGSYDIARLAAGGVLQLADAIAGGVANNGFALSRPPDHHAEHNITLNFYLFNNIAISAQYLQQHHNLNKIIIVN